MRLFLFLLLWTFSSGASYCNDAIYINNYNKAISLSEDVDHKILLIFDADWCVNCSFLKKDLSENIALQDIIVCILNIDNNKDIAKNFNIKKIPASILIEDKIIISKYIGYKNAEKYSDWLKSKGAL